VSVGVLFHGERQAAPRSFSGCSAKKSYAENDIPQLGPKQLARVGDVRGPSGLQDGSVVETIGYGVGLHATPFHQEQQLDGKHGHVV